MYLGGHEGKICDKYLLSLVEKTKTMCMTHPVGGHGAAVTKSR